MAMIKTSSRRLGARGATAARAVVVVVSRAVASALVTASVAAPCAAERAPGLDALKSAEQVLADLIERAEKAVVAIVVEPAAEVETPAAAGGGGGDRRRVGDNPGDFFSDLRSLREVGGPPAPRGAGVVIDPSGLVLTQYLVVQPGWRHIVATVDGQRFPAELIAADPRSGLAMLRITKPVDPDRDDDLAWLEIGNAERLRKGNQVVTIGNPQAILSDGQPTASLGAVTNLARKAGDQVNLNNARDQVRGTFRTTLHHFGTLVQTDAALGWNSNGGALVDLSGSLVGVATTVAVIPGHEQPAGYAIPMSKTMRRVVGVLREGKEVEYGLLGISFSTSTSPAGGGRGIEVRQAYPGGPAGRAGLAVRDLITHIAGQPVTGADQLQLVIGQRPPGERVEVRFLRRGRPMKVSAELAKHYPLGERIVTTPGRRWKGMEIDYSTALPQDQLDRATSRGMMDPAGCVVVRSVAEGSDAWKAGVRAGRFVSHVGGRRVRTPGEFWTAIGPAISLADLRFTDDDQAPVRPPRFR